MWHHPNYYKKLRANRQQATGNRPRADKQQAAGDRGRLIKFYGSERSVSEQDKVPFGSGKMKHFLMG
jgi:hypothetical protein